MAKVHTACKNCVFSVYDEKTQIDCLWGNLNKFEKLGTKIVEVYDDEKEFFVVEGRLCQFYRTDKWSNGKTPTEMYDQIQKETQIGVDILLLVHNDSTFEDIQHTIKSINCSSLLPQSIIIVFQNKLFVLTEENKTWLKNNCPCKFSYEIILEPEPSIEKCINLASRRSKIFYLCISAGSELEISYLKKLNNFINTNMVPIMYVSPIQVLGDCPDESYSHMFVARKLHDFVGGFGKKTIEEKVNNLIEDDSSWKNIKSTYETIYK